MQNDKKGFECEKYIFKYNNCHKFLANHGFAYVRAMMEKFIVSGAIEGHGETYREKSVR